VTGTTDTAGRVAAVRARIDAACERSGRSPGDVRLVAVTKYLDDATVDELVSAGVGDLGENRYQQLRDRAPRWPSVRWHAIGPLQANKVRYVARWAAAFHALDDVGLAGDLSARRLAEGLGPLPCYVQVNVAGEPSKSGVAVEALPDLLDGIAAAGLEGVEVVGLMAMPPLAPVPEASRPWFRTLARLAADHGLDGLSMGTSADFEVAVEEGATAVRVGGVLAG
jgi:pyridoxal phosphate enzyme (YggS family)